MPRMFRITAVNLDGQFALHAAHGFFHVVRDRLRKIPEHAGDFLQFAVHGGNQLDFFFPEHRPPLIFGLQIDEVFGIEEARGIGAIVGTPYLGNHLGDLRKGGQNDARLRHQPVALIRAGAGRQCAASPDGAFIQVRQELGPDDAAGGQPAGHGYASQSDAYGDPAGANGKAQRGAIAPDQPREHRITPLARVLAKCQAGEHRRQNHGEQQGAHKREGHRPGHGLEQTPFHALQREDGQVSRDDDPDGIKHRPLHFVGRFANAFHDRPGRASLAP
jgi:hypothetical protein